MIIGIKFIKTLSCHCRLLGKFGMLFTVNHAVFFVAGWGKSCKDVEEDHAHVTDIPHHTVRMW